MSVRSALWFLALAVCAAGCRGGKDEPAVDPALPEKLASCAAAIERAAAAPRSERTGILAAGCSPACPALATHGQVRDGDSAASPAERDTTLLLERCGMFCSGEARRAWQDAPPSGRFAALAASCGTAAYDLEPGQAHLLSETWLVLHRVRAWLHASRAAADPATLARLAGAGEHAHFPLPLPARMAGVYSLPGSTMGRPSNAAHYALMDGEHVRAAAMPMARILPARIELAPVPGGPFPGQILESPAASHAALVEQLRGSYTDEPLDTTPLVLADAATPVRRLVALAAELGLSRIDLAVAGQTAMEHPIALEPLTAAGSAAPVLELRDDALVIIGGDEDIRIPSGGDALERLEGELYELSVRWAPRNKIELALPPRATMAEMVALLDVIARTKLAVVLVRVAEGG